MKLTQQMCDLLNKYSDVVNDKYTSYTQKAYKLCKLPDFEPYAPGTVRQMISLFLKETSYTQSRDTFDIPEADLPETTYDHIFDYVISDCERLLVMSDVHVPYHDPYAIQTALRYGEQNGMDGILLNGDIIDCYALSRFTKDPKEKNFLYEIQSGEKFLRYLRDRYPNIAIHYKLGNHEKRFETFMYEKAPELSGLEDFNFKKMLRLAEKNIHLIEENRPMKFGKLYILHGHEVNIGYGGHYQARNMRLRTMKNVLFGHFHKTQVDSATAIDEKEQCGWSMGCLCGLRPGYMVINNWNQGFAFVERLDSAGNFKLYNERISRE